MIFVPSTNILHLRHFFATFKRIELSIMQFLLYMCFDFHSIVYFIYTYIAYPKYILSSFSVSYISDYTENWMSSWEKGMLYFSPIILCRFLELHYLFKIYQSQAPSLEIRGLMLDGIS